MIRKTLAAIAFTALTSSSAFALTIDAFDFSQTVTDPPGGSASTGTVFDAASILGGERFVSVQTLTGVTSAMISINDGSNGLMTLSNSANTSSSFLLYDGVGAAGLGGVDATEAGAQNAFDLRIVLNDFAATIAITVGSASGESVLSQSTGGGIPPASNIPLIFEYSNFITTLGSGATFTALDFIRIDISAPFQATDLQLDFFGTTNTEIPEPGSLALVGLGLAGIGLARRRRR